MNELRDIINVILEAEAFEDTQLVEEQDDMFESEEPEIDMSSEINDLIFKLRSHSEPLCESAGGSAYSFGFEAGLEMAAEMLENLLRRTEEDKSE